jgi:prepilin-type N-terminal cleavage/methylation domain-containing protein
MMKNDGFSIIELIVVLLVLGIMAAIAIPGFSGWLPNYRLKGAARDIYSNMQLAKMGAIKANADWAIVFDTTAGAHRYLVCSDDGDGDWTTTGNNTIERTVDLAGYKAGVSYGHGNAANGIPGGAFPGDDVSYTNNVAVFNPRGTSNETGYVYLGNSKNTTTYGVGTRISGVILLRKWNSSTSDWE